MRALDARRGQRDAARRARRAPARSRDRPLVETLLRLSRATGGDLGPAARGGRGRARLRRRPAAGAVGAGATCWRSRARAGSGTDGAGPPTVRGRRGAGASPSGPSRASRACTSEDGDARAMVDVLVAGDALPFPPRHAGATCGAGRAGRARPRSATTSARSRSTSRCSTTTRATRRPSTAGRDLPAHGTHRATCSPCASARSPPRRPAATRIGCASRPPRLLVTLGEARGAVDTLRANLEERRARGDRRGARRRSSTRRASSPELRDLLADQAQRAEEAGDAARAAELWSRAAGVAEERPARLERGRDLPRARRRARAARRLVRRARPAATSRADAAAAAELAREARSTSSTPERAAWRGSCAWPTRSSQSGQAAARGRAARAVAVLELPEAEPLRERLAALYREQGAWARLAQLVAASAAHAPDKATTHGAPARGGARCSPTAAAQPATSRSRCSSRRATWRREDPAVRLQLAERSPARSRFDEARAILQAMIDAFGGRRPKERAPVHYQIARLELAMGNRARALVELDTATRVDPQNPEILRTLAELARDDGQLDRAEKSYRALLVVLRRREDAGERAEHRAERGPARAQRHRRRARARAIARGRSSRARWRRRTKSDFEQERLEASLRARGDDETLVRVLEAKLGAPGRLRRPRPRRWPSSPTCSSERLQTPEQALPVRLRAVAHRSAVGARRTRRRWRSRARWAGSSATSTRAAALVDRAVDGGRRRPRRASLLVRLGAVAEQDLHDDAPVGGALRARASSSACALPRCCAPSTASTSGCGDADKQARVLWRCASRSRPRRAGRARPRATPSTAWRRCAWRRGRRSTRASRCCAAPSTSIRSYDRAEQASCAARSSWTRPTRRLLDLYERVGRAAGARARAHRRPATCGRSCPAADVATVREAVESAVQHRRPRAGRVRCSSASSRASRRARRTWQPGVGPGRPRDRCRRRRATCAQRRRAEEGGRARRRAGGGAQARLRGGAASRRTSWTTSRWPRRRTRRCAPRDPGGPGGLGAARRRVPAPWASHRKLADLLGARRGLRRRRRRARAASASSACAR